MRIALKAAAFILNIAYCPIKVFPARKKVAFLSRQDDKPGIDIMMLSERIKQKDSSVDVVVLAKKIGETNRAKLQYCFHMIRQMYHIATSKIVIIDGYCPLVSILKHKRTLRVIQIWHAVGAIKKFGYQILNKEEGRGASIAEAFKMHRNYDVISCASRATRRYFAEAFHVDEGIIKIWGMPRIDYIQGLHTDRDAFFRRYPAYRCKKIILYVPTFRMNRGTDFHQVDAYELPAEYAVIIRKHPLDCGIVRNEYLAGSEYDTYQLMDIADYIITDYSAIGIEACLFGKPVYFNLYDYEQYLGERGVNIDLKAEMKDAVCFDFPSVMEKIISEHYDFEQLKRFRKKYIETAAFDNTGEIASAVLGYVKEDFVGSSNTKIN